MTHWIHTSGPLSVVTVDVPASSGLAAPAVGVTHLVVAADGERVEAPDSLDLRTGWTGSLAAAHDVYVQYQASGILRRTGSVEGRELALLTSLDVEVGRALSKSQTSPGVQVLSLACLPPGDQAMPRPCGILDDNTWTVTTEPGSRSETVIAQIDVAAG